MNHEHKGYKISDEWDSNTIEFWQRECADAQGLLGEVESQHIILQGAYDLAIENLRLIREEFLMEGETNIARVEELLFIDAWRKHQKVTDEQVP